MYPGVRRICAKLLAAVLLAGGTGADGQVIISDNYNVTANGTGFALDMGVNTGINPPTTRLTGTAAPNLRYLQTFFSKPASQFDISGSRLRVMKDPVNSVSGRFTVSADGSTPFDFGPVLGVAGATPANPVTYDLNIKMRNDATTASRFSFALTTQEGHTHYWDFGVQVYRASSGDTLYTIQKRIDRGSYNGTTTSDATGDLNLPITTAGAVQTMVSFLIRVTDAGAESGADYHSRVRVSMDGGSTWIYDTSTDSDLPNGFRLDGPGRYIDFDVAGNLSASVFYDGFSIVPAPVSATLISPQTNATNLGASPILTAAVSNQAPNNVTVTFYGRVADTSYLGRDFAIAVLPDTQNYARESSGVGEAVKEMWFAQTDWIVANRVSRNIAYVAHLGDIVQNGDIKDGKANTTEWRNATNAMYRLENPIKTLLPYGIPYGMAVGNHDQEPIGDENGTTTFYNQYFGISHFEDKPYYGGHYSDNNDSHFDLFSVSGLDFIVLYFEFGRYGSTILNWANGVLATNQNRRAIVVTHYAGSDTTPSNLSTQGQAIYDGLKANTNYFLMFGGHVASNGGEGSRTNTYLGNAIRTYISDFQGWMNGGNGFMRLLYFSPSNNLVTIKTYSPWLDEYRTDANSQMTFPYDMLSSLTVGQEGTPYALLGTFTQVPPGSLVSCPFPALEPNTLYEWYVRVTDAAGNSVISPTGSFVTSTNFPPEVTNRVFMVAGDEPTPLELFASDSNVDYLTLWTVSPPLRGLASDWDAVNGTLTYVPTPGYHGIDRFTYQASDGMTNSQVGTVVLSVTAPPDTDGNGLPDYYESTYGVSDPNADDDQDGEDTLAEYYAGTNPTNAASVLKVLSVEWSQEDEGEEDVVGAGNPVTLTWASVGGTRYRVQYSNGGANGGPSGPFIDVVRDAPVEIDPSPYRTASTQSFIQTPTNTVRYYRIQVVP